MACSNGSAWAACTAATFASCRAGNSSGCSWREALVRQPDLLVLDEPAGGVDVATRHEILHLLADLHDGGLPIVLTTHDINGLAAHLPRLMCFNRTVIADGPPAEVLHPYVLERTYGAPMDVLQHGGMPVVLESRGHRPHQLGGEAS